MMACNKSAYSGVTLTHAISERTKQNNGCCSGLSSGSGREDCEEIPPTLSQTSALFDYFGNSPGFWGEAAQMSSTSNESQFDTPPLSFSSVTCGSGSTSSGSILNTSSATSDSSPFIIPCISSSKASSLRGTASLKRKASQASVASDKSSRAPKIARIELQDQSNTSAPPSSQIDTYINLSPPHILQTCIDRRELPYSVQWELARLVSKGLRSWEGDNALTLGELDRLRPAPDSKTGQLDGVKKVAKVLQDDYSDNPYSHLFNDERKATDPWAEFEREEAFLAENPDTELLVDKDWYGGQVHFIATLKKATTNNKTLTMADYKIELESVERATSNSFSRRFGSKNFLRLKIQKALLHKSVFRAFYAKEQTVFFFRTNEVWDAKTRTISVPPPCSPGISLMDFIQWYNPTEYNSKQTMAKWASRFALGLSSSIPGITLDEENIGRIDDIKSESGSDMTDGAGLINRCLLHKLTRMHDWEFRPSAIQVRVMGSKGLLVEHPEIYNETMSIQLRPSLIKTKYLSPLDVTHRTIDILRIAHARSPIRIATDVIINLHENGIKATILQRFLKKSLEEIIQPLLDWDPNDPWAMRRLWASFERVGFVVKGRRAREEVAVARVKGYTALDVTEEVDEEEDTFGADENAERSSDWWPDMISGCPSSLEETVMAFLDSGFRPETCTILRDKILKVIQHTINRVIENFSIDIPQSAGAWLVPDPTGLLEAKQIFFKSSQARLISQDGTETDTVIGDVLITRDPCRLPTDVQKWCAVDIPELHYLKDVIVLSVQGPRRAADWLAGGDYDGDKAKIIWQPELVENFRNANENFATPPEDLDSFFKEENERVDEFLRRVQGSGPEYTLYEMQKYLLGMMQDQMMVGMYSGFHEYSTYSEGYASEKTKLLAYMFTTILDGRKTGKSVRPEVFKEHRNRYSRRIPWKEAGRKVKEGEPTFDNNIPLAKRAAKLRPFIMDELLSYGKKLRGEMFGALGKSMEKYKHEADSDLTRPYLQARQRVDMLQSRDKAIAEALEAELDLIKRHVEGMYKEHCEMLRDATLYAERKRTATSGAGFSNISIGKRQDVLRRLSARFHSGLSGDGFRVLSEQDVCRVKASYAYYYDSEHKATRFPWNVAFRDLCAIKCGERLKPVQQGFYDHMLLKIPKNHKKAW